MPKEHKLYFTWIRGYNVFIWTACIPSWEIINLPGAPGVPGYPAGGVGFPNW